MLSFSPFITNDYNFINRFKIMSSNNVINHNLLTKKKKKKQAHKN